MTQHMMENEQFVQHMITAAENGGKQIMKWYGKVLTTQRKSTVADFRTQADVASEKAVLEVLNAEFPDFNVFAEESGWQQKDSEYTFVIDPLDGTNNFSLTLPNFSVSIGLMKGDETVAGVIHSPVNGHTYSVARGAGAFFMGERLSVSDVQTVAEATVAFGMGYEGDPAINQAAVSYLHNRKLKRSMSNWSPAVDLSLIAAGKVDGFICNNNEIYDNMAGKLMIREAGGVILDWNGEVETDERSVEYIAASTPELARELINAIQFARE